MANLPAGLFINYNIGGHVFVVRLEDDKWSSLEDMVPFQFFGSPPLRRAVSACKRIGSIPINGITRKPTGTPFKEVTYLNQQVNQTIFRGLPTLDKTYTFSGNRTDPIIVAISERIRNALSFDLHGDDGSFYPAGTFYQSRGQLLSTWIFQDTLNV